MEFSIKREQLLSAMARTQGIVERRHTMPILANVLIEAAHDEIIVKVTDLEVGLTASYPAKVETTGPVTVPARMFYETIRELSHESVHIRAKDNNSVELKCGSATCNIVGMDATEFPTLPSFEAANFFALPGRPLREMLDMTVFAASTDETRYNLNGVCWEMRVDDGQKKLRLAATDGHRLALVNWAGPGLENAAIGSRPESGPSGVILPRKGVNELRRMLEESRPGRDEEPIQVAFSRQMAGFKREGQFLMVRLIEGDFPDYEQVIPTSWNHKAILSREETLSILRLVSLYSSEKGRGVKFKFVPGSLEVSARNPDRGEAREVMEVIYEGQEGFSMAFNARYIMDVLSVLKAEKVSLEMTDELSPGVIKPVSEEDHLSLIMPMRM